MFESKRHALAYLMGVYLSDGSLDIYSGAFVLEVADKEFCDPVAEAMKMIGAKFTPSERKRRPVTSQVTGKVYQRKRQYKLKERSPYPVGRRFELEFWGGKDHLPLPYITDDIARDLVAGVMDGDGSISKFKRKSDSYRLGVAGVSKYLADLQKLFASFDVLMHYHPSEVSHPINIKSFAKAEFYFRLSRKQAILKAYKKSRFYLR